MAFKGLREKKNGFTFYWKINHFSLCSYFENSIMSPVFRVEEMDNAEWTLRLFPGQEVESDVVLNIHREIEDMGPEEISVDVKLFLLKTNGDKVIEEIEDVTFAPTSYLIKPLKQKKSSLLRDGQLFLLEDTLTVGCFVKKHSKNISSSVECTAYTEISTEKFSFSIPFHIDRQLQQAITILKASVSKKYPSFKIILEPIFSIPNNKEFMTVKIVMRESRTDVLCKCMLSVEDSQKKVVFLFEGRHKYYANSNDLTWKLTNSVVAIEEKLDFTNDFNLRCVFVVSDGAYSSHIKDLIYPISMQPKIKQLHFPDMARKQSHMQKLKCLFEDSILCDFTLQVDGKNFRIHKAVLGAVSPVFRAMFERELEEKKNSVAIIEDIDANTVQKLIDFAYSENVEDLHWESALKLYGAANRYLIEDLKQCCASRLIANLTIDNVTEVLTISDMCEDNNLYLEAGEFVYANAKGVFRSEKWKAFIGSNATAAIKIMQEICLKFTLNG